MSASSRLSSKLSGYISRLKFKRALILENTEKATWDIYFYDFRQVFDPSLLSL
jgi:hypothetical protein